MEIMLTDMLENGGCEGKTESAVKILSLDLCGLPLSKSPDVFIFSTRHSRPDKGVPRYTNQLRHP